jgi:pre-mRNA-processing factor 19
VSGVVPEEPVVCIKSGHLYEKRLVEKHIETTGQEPVTKEEVSISDLLPVKGEFPPQVPRAAMS